MIEKIKQICGNEGDITLLNNIANDPNFVFENDPAYETVVLFNESGSIINVNSWLECANYVNGGWISSQVDLVNGEKILFFIMSTILVGYIGGIIIRERVRNY